MAYHIYHHPHAELRFPQAAVPAGIVRPIRLQIVSPCTAPPEGGGWLHEAKHDGHRLLAIIAGDRLTLLSHNGHDRTAVFREPFRSLAGLPPLVLDGEIGVPDERGVTHIDALTKAMRQHGGEGIVSKRAGSLYRGGTNRDWLKAKVSETGAFVITGFTPHEAVAVTELKDGVLLPAGQVQFGLCGKSLWQRLDRLRDGTATRSGIVPVRPELVAEVRYFGRYRTGWIRDGVLLSIG